MTALEPIQINGKALGIIETVGLVPAVEAGDVAVKAAEVTIIACHQDGDEASAHSLAADNGDFRGLHGHVTGFHGRNKTYGLDYS